MKKTSIALILAAALILLGAALTAAGLFRHDFSPESMDATRWTEKNYVVNEPFDSIRVNTTDHDVTFVKTDGDFRMVCQESDRVQYTVIVEEGTLKIDVLDHRKWYNTIGIFTENMEVTVYLPQKQYASVQVYTATGDIVIPEAYSIWEIMLRSDTGEISCVGADGDVLDCMTATGDISIQNSTPVLTKLQSGTGDLKVSVVASEEIHLKTNTGEVDAQNVNGQMFTCSSDTGEVELEQVNAEDYLQIRTTTGDVAVDNCDAGRVDIETDTGDISGNFLTAKIYQAVSQTGNVAVPNTREGGECRIETNTGSIRFE